MASPTSPDGTSAESRPQRESAPDESSLSLRQVRAIAKEAYVYGFPMVDNYRVLHAYFVDRGNPEFKGPWNQITSVARVYGPADKTIQTPNSDTPYSALGADLRAEPLVLTLPAIENDRYYSAQFVDLYTQNFAYAGSRTTGNQGGKFLLAGPSWKGETPAGITSVIRSETELALVIYRTQLFAAADMENVKRIQAGYEVQPLSAFLRTPPPPAPAAIDFIKPLSAHDERTSPQFFNVLNFLLSFCPADPDEQELRQRFAKLGIEAGKRFDLATLTPEMFHAIRDGMANAWRAHEEISQQLAAGQVSAGDLFGTRAELKSNYQYRMAGAVVGIYGNSRAEALYPVLSVDSKGQRLSGEHRYTLRFAPDQVPPVNAFWSLTMYRMPASLLVANPINRYLINSPMLPSLKRDADGGVTLYVQQDSPGADREANWLPAPPGAFITVMRLYWPKAAAVDGTWQAPSLQRAG